ncbi:MAG: leucine-rich repeat domain-containing protein [Clostridia bacterium]|nr:leucine-rich repeat domain-containing protein [Clostridia bacterium]
MKKRIVSLLLALALILPLCPAFELPLLSLPVSAATGGTTGDCTWELKGTVLTISGNGKMGDNKYGGPWGTSITKVIIEDGVTSVGDYAFYGCSSLTSITIGNSVTSIGNSAFAGCSSLTSITIPGSVENVGEWAFHACGLTDIIIEEGVTSIGGDAFSNCNNLTSVAIPNSVTSIGDHAFHECGKLANVIIPEGVTSIEENTFTYCSSLTSITIPGSVKNIDESAFYGCRSLSAVTIPDSVTNIGASAFSYCSSLTMVWYEGSVSDRSKISIGSDNDELTAATWHYDCCMENESVWTHVYDSACDTECNECGKIRIPPHVYDNKVDVSCNVCGAERTLPYDDYGTTGDCTWTLDGTKLTISGNGKMGDYTSTNEAPWGTSITEVIIEDGVTSIGDYAFYGCSSLTSISIGNSVTSIGKDAFYGCSSLTAITIPDSVTSIGDGAFADCSSLTAITIPDSVTTIGMVAFINCDSLTAITIPDSVTSIGSSAFWFCTSLTSITIPDSVTSIGSPAFAGCSSLTSIAVAEGNPVYHSAGNCLIETESKTLIAGCQNSIIPSDGSVTSIGSSAFSYCSSLTAITIPDSVTSIGSYAFDSCDSLTAITIPDSVKSIGFYAFHSCTKITTINIPDSVASIESRAFNGCSSLTSITVAEGNPVYHSAGNCLIETDSKTLITGCPNSIIPSDGSVTSIADWAFWYCTSLTTITIPDSVTSIGDSAFSYCSSLTTVWYEGSESDRRNISIGDSNDPLATATWHYDSCMKNEGVWTHVYDNVCDVDCNECGEVRAVPDHVYDNVCDADCNECGEVRSTEHVYDDASDVTCNVCGLVNLEVASSINLSVEERIYLNLWLDAEDVDACKALTGKDFTYDATVETPNGMRALGSGSVSGAPVETEYGTYYIIRLDAVSAELFDQRISVKCPTGTINAVGDESLTVLSLAKAGAAQYEEQMAKDLFTALYNYGASATGKELLTMPQDFVKDLKENISVFASPNETALFQNVFLLMGDSIGIRLKGQLLGDEKALSVKIFNGSTEYKNPPYSLIAQEDGTLTLDLYVSADHFNTKLKIRVYSGEEVIAGFTGTIKGYSEQIANNESRTLALAQFVQACVNYKYKDPTIPDHMDTEDVPDVGTIPL